MNKYKHDLYLACEDGKLDVVKKIIEENPNVDLNFSDQYARTPFYMACLEGHFEIVKFLVKEKRVNINKADQNERSPFYIACSEGHLKIVELLVADEGVNINKADQDGRSPFYIACSEGRLEIVKFLVKEERIDVNQPDNEGWTPLTESCSKGHVEVAKFLAQGRHKQVDITNAFYEACREGIWDIVTFLLSLQEFKEHLKKQDADSQDIEALISTVQYARDIENTKNKIIVFKNILEIVINNRLDMEYAKEIKNEIENVISTFNNQIHNLASNFFALILFHCDWFLEFSSPIAQEILGEDENS